MDCAVCSSSLRLIAKWIGIKRQCRQRIERSRNVKELRIGIDVGGKIRLAVSHRGLGCAEWHSSLAQVSAEGRAKGMDIDRAASFVALVDESFSGLQVLYPTCNTCCNEIAIKDANKPVWHVKELLICLQSHGDWFPNLALGGGLQSAELIAQPPSQISDQVGANWALWKWRCE
jgi:hypothetical protein